jgi:hypothetical protein
VPIRCQFSTPQPGCHQVNDTSKRPWISTDRAHGICALHFGTDPRHQAVTYFATVQPTRDVGEKFAAICDCERLGTGENLVELSIRKLERHGRTTSIGEMLARPIPCEGWNFCGSVPRVRGRFFCCSGRGRRRLRRLFERADHTSKIVLPATAWTPSALRPPCRCDRRPAGSYHRDALKPLS